MVKKSTKALKKPSDITADGMNRIMGAMKAAGKAPRTIQGRVVAAKEIAEIPVIEAYLPRAATAEEVDAAVAAAIAETGASSIKDMGNVMKAAMAHLAGKSADGRMVSDAVKGRLST